MPQRDAEIYRDSDFALLLDEISATLQRRGHVSVPRRTYEIVIGIPVSAG